MNNMKLVAGIFVFGSLWGFSEVIIGPRLDDTGFPSGILMTGIFALFFLVISRMIYKQPGMQLGIGFVAGTLRLFNPFGGCHVCSAIAIMAEGALFELIWYQIKDDKHLNTLTLQGSIGIATAYCVYVGGYAITQVITPISYGQFVIENLITYLPQILASGLLVALIGCITVPFTIAARKLPFKLKDPFYYPTTMGVSTLCWSFIIISWYVTIA